MNKSLEDLAIISYGRDYKSNPKGDTVPIIGTGGVMGFTSLKLNTGPAILTGRKGSINNPFYIEGDFWNVDTIFSIKTKEKVDPKWLYYNFKNTDLTKLNEATGVPSVSAGNLYRLKFNFVEYPNQKKIAKILSTCDKVIEKTETAIAKYQSIKQGMMHDLFIRGIDIKTGKLRPKQEDAPELYKESTLGWIPKEWEERSLEELTTYVDYRGKTPPKSDKGIFLVTAKNVKFGYINYEISKEYIPNASYGLAMSRGIPELGDILITTEAPLGNIAQIDIEGIALAQRVIKYRTHVSLMSNNYLKYSLMSEYFQKKLISESTGSTVKGIKGSRLHKLKVYKPLLEEQTIITSSLQPIEEKIETEQSTLSKYQQIKKGLMQDLLTGKVEVKIDEEELVND